MLKKYRNQLLLEIKNKNIEIEKFIIEDFKEENVFRNLHEKKIIRNGIKICLKDSPLVYSILNTEESYDEFEIEFIPFTPNLEMVYIDIPDFKKVLDHFNTWHDFEVKKFLKNLAEPDLWSIFLNEKFNISEIGSEEIENFTIEEIENTTQAIENFKKSIEEKMELTNDELKKINKKLDNITEKIEQLNKSDWKDFANGVVLDIVTSTILDPVQQTHFITLLKNAFSFFPKLIGG